MQTIVLVVYISTVIIKLIMFSTFKYTVSVIVTDKVIS